ncbi:lasso peptide biosynthesis B2 protein [Lysinibacillus macroides]|nr:lasso peptide biosynthesis B2 protein [Lysinibacillus macroides]
MELSYKGFNKTFKNYSQKFNNVKEIMVVNNESDKNAIEEYLEMMDIVCTWYPRKADCIQKSFLGYRLLRKKYAIPVEIAIGIRKYPFAAHAWLVYNDMNFLYDEEDTAHFKIIMNTKYERDGG